MKKILLLLISGSLSLIFSGFNSYAAPPIKKKFTIEEDTKLIHLVQEHGKSWRKISNLMGNRRSPRNCRERYKHYLSKKINNSPWSPEEDHLLIQKYNELGSKWAEIANHHFNNTRTQIQIKSRFHLLQRKKVKDIKLYNHELYQQKLPQQQSTLNKTNSPDDFNIEKFSLDESSMFFNYNVD